jgi:rRNA maturation protein Nop10
MVRTKLQRCIDCGEYGLGDICKSCNGKMTAVAPLKYSPEDPQGARRRQRVDAGSEEWIESLPTPREVIKGEEE